MRVVSSGDCPFRALFSPEALESLRKHRLLGESFHLMQGRPVLVKRWCHRVVNVRSAVTMGGPRVLRCLSPPHGSS